MRYPRMSYKNTKRQSRGATASISISRADLPAWVYAKPVAVAHAATSQTTLDAADDLLTIAEVARYLRVSDRTVSRLIRAGQLPVSRIGRALRIRQSDLLNLLDEKPNISDG